MNNKDLENVLQITELVTKIGIPMIQSILNTVAEKSPSIAEIYKLRQAIKDPESYFESGDMKPNIDLEAFANDGLELDTSKLGVIPSADPVDEKIVENYPNVDSSPT